MGTAARPITRPAANGWMIPSRVCQACPVGAVCGSQKSELACPDDPAAASLTHQFHPQHKLADQIVADIGDFNFPDAYTPVRTLDFPAVIPVIVPGTHACWALPSWICVQISELLRKDGSIRPAEEVRRSLHLSPRQRLIVSCHDEDDDLRDIWIFRMRITDQLAAAGFDAVLSPGFSSWAANYRFDQIISQHQSLALFKVMHRAGIAAIPHLSGVTKLDWERAGEWLAGHPEIEVACLDVQRSRSPLAWEEEVAAIAILASKAGRLLQWVVNGVANRERLRTLVDALGAVTVVTKDPYMRAVVGRGPWPSGFGSRSNEAKAVVFDASLAAMTTHMHQLDRFAEVVQVGRSRQGLARDAAMQLPFDQLEAEVGYR